MPAFALYLALHHAGLTLETDGHKLTVTPAIDPASMKLNQAA